MHENRRFTFSTVIGRRLAWAVFLAVTGASWLAFATSAKAPDSPRDILLLYNDMSQIPANQEVFRGFREVLEADDQPAPQIFDEYLDAPRFPGPEHFQAVAQYLKAKYEGMNIEVVVVLATEAVDFVIQHKAALFPNSRIVFAAVDEATGARMLASLPDATGIVSQLNPVKSLELALRLQPETRNIAVVTGAADFDQQWRKVAQAKFRDKESSYRFIYLSGLPMDRLLEEVARLPPQTVIIFLSVFADGAGQQFIPRNVAEKVAAVANAPVYSVYDTMVGRGIVGGFMDTFVGVGRATGNLALQAMEGSDNAGMSTREAETHRYIVDWRQIERWGIDAAGLPPDTEIRFRAATLWEAYRTQVLAALGLLALQTIAVIGLLLQMRRRRKAEASLKESENRMAFAASSVNVAMWHVDLPDGSFWATDHCRRMFGLSDGDPMTPDALLERVHPDDRQTAARVLQADSLGSRDTEFRVITGDGSVRWIAARSHLEQSNDHRMRLGGSFADITARKMAESEADLQRNELARLTRASVLGQLSGALAHELNQPLTAILANAQAAQDMLKRNEPDLPEVESALADIVTEDHRAGEVIKRLSRLLKKGDQKHEDIDANEIVRSTLTLLRSQLLAHRVETSMQLEEPLPIVRGDPIQLQQVLINLVVNAVDAMGEVKPAGRRLIVRTNAVEPGSIMVSVQDSGRGLKEAAGQAFEPFYTTKPHGLGLGLAICSTIVGKHGGVLNLDNHADGGAVAIFTLPRAAVAAE